MAPGTGAAAAICAAIRSNSFCRRVTVLLIGVKLIIRERPVRFILLWICVGAGGHRLPVPLRLGRRAGVAHDRAQSGLPVSVHAHAAGERRTGSAARQRDPLVFGTLERAAAASKYDDADRKLSASIQDYWTNVAKTGDPNGGVLPRWPKFDPVARAYLDFTGSGAVSKAGLRREICDLYTERRKSQMTY